MAGIQRCGCLPNFHKIDVVLDLWIELTGPLDALLSDGLLDLVVLIPSFLQRGVRPFGKPVPVRQGYERASALVFAT